ncbi:MAG: hypothetical protein LBI36_04990 [Oscillospiraceae bacterium]|jgi:hypothetical protein|nr:hypothetical protein [Oscillospiraceae bacterium]
MNTVVVSSTMNIDGREFLLADVSRGMGQVGVLKSNSAPGSDTDVFYVESEPVFSMSKHNAFDPAADKLIAQVSGIEKCSDYVKTRLSVVGDNFFLFNQGLARSVTPVLELLTEGLYVVHESKMIPSDGAGNFFWNAYNIRHEVAGSADKNSVIGDANFSPCFLIPCEQAASYQPKKMSVLSEKIEKGKISGGVAYHVTGMFSALLDGHHTATACLLNDKDFKCLVIEPLNDVVYDSEENPGKKKIIALSCPFVKIPIGDLPENMLERFLVTRKYARPATYGEIKSKAAKSVKTTSKRAFPAAVYEKAAQLPDCAMAESAAGVNNLSEEQLGALLAGEVKYDDKIIISSNYYSSVTTACNYLQTANFARFLTFALDIMRNEGLSAAHKYVAERLLNIMHPSVHEYFASVAAEKGETDGFVPEIAHKYIKRWEEHREIKRHEEEAEMHARKKRHETLQAVSETRGIATLEAAVRDIGNIPKK